MREDKIGQYVEARAAERPAVLGDEVFSVLLQPLDGPFGDMTCDWVLLAVPGPVSSHSLDLK